MKNLFESSTAAEVKERIGRIGHESVRQWGKMTAPQMLAHCSTTMEAAVGDMTPKRMLIGKVLGPLFRTQFSNERQLNKNGPTHPDFIVSDERDLATEQARLIRLVDRFSQGGPQGCTAAPHAFFGNISPEEWATGMYKHMDHHLRQFGV